MPKAATKKTKLGHKNTHETPASGSIAAPDAAKWPRSLLISCVLIGAALLAALVAILLLSNTDNGIDLKSYQLETVSTNAAREKGLSDRASLGPNRGMLFDFSDGANGRCFWMRDMRFAIDIVWLDSSSKITKLVKDAQPSSYPTSFCSSENPRYVIELPAGTIQELKMRLNMRVDFTR